MVEERYDVVFDVVMEPGEDAACLVDRGRERSGQLGS